MDKDQELDYVKAQLDFFNKENNTITRYFTDDVFGREFLANLITSAQEFVRNALKESAVSQRDLQRVFQFLQFFYKKKTESMKTVSREDREEALAESVLLSIALVYYFRLDSGEEENNPRESFAETINNQILTLGGRKYEHLEFIGVLEDEMNLYVEELTLPGSIAENQSLKENLFSIIVCIENTIPLIITGTTQLII